MSVLQRIISRKREEIARLKREVGAARLLSTLDEAPPARNFVAALRDSSRVPVIAEIKRISPSEGALKTGVDVPDQARSYEAGGAAALSVLTDETFFGGRLQDLTTAREAVSVPVLRKDFILDRVQLYESRAAGADAVLLIAAALKPILLKELFLEARELGMASVVEVHHESELDAVLKLQPQIVGINNRDLTTLNVDLETSIRLRPLIPEGIVAIGESGIKSPEDVKRLLHAGLDAFLVGTALMRSPDPEAALRDLCAARSLPWSA